jgi:hypothetical protein
MLKRIKKKIILASILLCILVFSILLILDSKETFLKKDKINSSNLYLVYKYSNVHYKRFNLSNWKDLILNSRLNFLDEIRTLDKSEAILATQDHSVKIILEPNSILFLKNEANSFEFKKGNLLFNSEINFGVDIDKENFSFTKSNFRISKLDDLIILYPYSNFEFDYKGSKVKAEVNEIIHINLASNEFKKYPIQEKISNLKNSEIFFLDKAKYTELDDILLNKNIYIFKDELIEKNKINFINSKFYFEEGIYYLLIQENNDIYKSNLYKFLFLSKKKSSTIYPISSQIYYTNSKKEFVHFYWSNSEIDRSYTLEVSKTNDFKEKTILKTTDNNFYESEFEISDYFWRVKVDLWEGASYFTETKKFSISTQEKKVSKHITSEEFSEIPYEPQKAKEFIQFKEYRNFSINKPFIYFPKEGSVLDLNLITELQFRWSQVPGARSYLAKLETNTKMILFEIETEEPKFPFRSIGKLEVGNYIFSVEAIPGDEKLSRTKIQSTFTIVYKESSNEN